MSAPVAHHGEVAPVIVWRFAGKNPAYGIYRGDAAQGGDNAPWITYDSAYAKGDSRARPSPTVDPLEGYEFEGLNLPFKHSLAEAMSEHGLTEPHYGPFGFGGGGPSEDAWFGFATLSQAKAWFNRPADLEKWGTHGLYLWAFACPAEHVAISPHQVAFSHHHAKALCHYRADVIYHKDAAALYKEARARL